MLIETWYDPEDGNAPAEKSFESFDQAIEFLADLNRKAIEEAVKEENLLLSDEEFNEAWDVIAPPKNPPENEI